MLATSYFSTVDGSKCGLKIQKLEIEILASTSEISHLNFHFKWFQIPTFPKHHPPKKSIIPVSPKIQLPFSFRWSLTACLFGTAPRPDRRFGRCAPSGTCIASGSTTFEGWEGQPGKGGSSGDMIMIWSIHSLVVVIIQNILAPSKIQAYRMVNL